MQIDEKLKIRPGEDAQSYINRISAMHDSVGFRWQEIADIINSQTGNTYNESKYRKAWKNSQSSDDFSEKMNIASRIEEYDDPIAQNNDIEIRNRYLESTSKIPYLRAIRQDVRFEQFYRLIADRLELYTPPVIKYKPTSAQRKEYVLTLADMHIGAKFDALNNKYSIAEVEKRLNKALSYIVDFVEEHEIKRLHILSLGDIVQGMLRLTDLKINELAVVDAFVIACRLIANFLNELSAYCEIDFHQVCFSNHDETRPLGTKATELAGEDLGKVFFAYITDVLAANDRIKTYGDTNHDYAEFKLFDFECIALHGHQIQNVKSAAKDLSAQHRKFYDYVFLGHAHSEAEATVGEGTFHNIQVFVAPSFVGSDPYADKLMVGSKASIKIFEFHEKYGHTASYDFILN